ncbi:MAG: hypothetical protein HQ580_10650 [Planctomycetes bacterium]|nr:hypothetical protein [Planctomycetota bacterium]
MSKNKKNKAGLHKEISSIFKGIVIPQNDDGQKSSSVPEPEHTDNTEPKQQAPGPQKSEDSKPCKVTQSLPKAETSQESKAEPAHTPKFMTAQESKVVPIQQSEVEKVQEPKVEEVQESKAEPAQRPKVVPIKGPKAEAAQRPKADIDDSAKKGSKEITAVKIGIQASWKQITNKLFASKEGVTSTKQKVTVLTMPALFIVLLIIMFKGGVFGTSVSKTEAGEENNASGVAAASSNDKIEWELPVPYSTKLRDPMSLAPVAITQTGTQTEPVVQLIVKGILYSEDKPSIVIGNRILHEGDQIQNASVIKINRGSVEFEMNGNKWAQKVQR